MTTTRDWNVDQLREWERLWQAALASELSSPAGPPPWHRYLTHSAPTYPPQQQPQPRSTQPLSVVLPATASTPDSALAGDPQSIAPLPRYNRLTLRYMDHQGEPREMTLDSERAAGEPIVEVTQEYRPRVRLSQLEAFRLCLERLRMQVRE